MVSIPPSTPPRASTASWRAVLEEGALDAHDIVLVEDYAKDKALELGQDIEVLTPYRITDLRIVGLMAKEGPGQLNNGAFGVVRWTRRRRS